MRDVVSAHPAQRRAAVRRALALHRPRPPTWSRVPQEQGRMRMSDIVLALLSVALLGGLALTAAIALIGQSLTP